MSSAKTSWIVAKMDMAKGGEGDDPRRSGGSYKGEWENDDAPSGHSLLCKSAEEKMKGSMKNKERTKLL